MYKQHIIYPHKQILQKLDLDKIRKAVKQKNTISFIIELGMDNVSSQTNFRHLSCF